MNLPPTLSPAADLVNEIQRIFKARRLYGTGHPQLAEIETTATSRITHLLEEAGSISLTITEEALHCDGEAVYRHPPGPESLTYLLFREGIRQLAFFPGLEATELTAFLDHLAATARDSGADSDLIARLWDENLVHIRYVFFEELADEEWKPAAALEEAPEEPSPTRIIEEEAEELQDSKLKIDSDVTLYFLDEDDLAALHAELEEEKARTLVHECLTCIVELLFDPVLDDPTSLLGAVAEVQASMLDRGCFAEVLQLHDVFRPYLESDQSGPEAERFFTALRREALAAAPLSRLSGRLLGGLVGDDLVAAWYRAFGPTDLAALLSGAGDLKLLCQRPALRSTLTSLVAADPAALGSAIGAESSEAACAAVHLAGLVAEPSLIEPLVTALSSDRDAVRVEALLALKRYDDPRAIEAISDRIGDSDPTVRLYALRHLIARRYTLAFPRVAALLARAGDEAWPLAERRLVFEAYGALGGAGAVEDLGSRLERRVGWRRRIDPDEAACAVVGLAATRTEAARRLVDRATRSAHPLVQRVARQAAAAWNGAEHSGGEADP